MAGNCNVASESMKQAARRPRPPLPRPASGSSSISCSRFQPSCSIACRTIGSAAESEAVWRSLLVGLMGTPLDVDDYQWFDATWLSLATRAVAVASCPHSGGTTGSCGTPLLWVYHCRRVASVGEFLASADQPMSPVILPHYVLFHSRYLLRRMNRLKDDQFVTSPLQ